MEFKFKLNGQKVRARLLGDDEVITEKTLKYFNGPEQFWRINKDNVESLKSAKWMSINSTVGDKVSEYPSFVFIEILSPFYKA